MVLRYGGIAQLARAHGSYPWCRGFKSPSRYLLAPFFRGTKKALTEDKTLCIITLALMPCRPGCGSAWLECLIWDQEVAGSNPVTPTFKTNNVEFDYTSEYQSKNNVTCGCSSVVEHQPSKLDMCVRFPSPAIFFATDTVM